MLFTNCGENFQVPCAKSRILPANAISCAAPSAGQLEGDVKCLAPERSMIATMSQSGRTGVAPVAGNQSGRSSSRQRESRSASSAAEKDEPCRRRSSARSQKPAGGASAARIAIKRIDLFASMILAASTPQKGRGVAPRAEPAGSAPSAGSGDRPRPMPLIKAPQLEWLIRRGGRSRKGERPGSHDLTSSERGGRNACTRRRPAGARRATRAHEGGLPSCAADPHCLPSPSG